MNVQVSDRTLEGPHGPLPVRIYAPVEATGPGLVWLHGGAFAGGDLDMPEADWVSRRLAAEGIVVVSVDYALASDGGAHHPVPSQEAAFAFGWAAASDLASGPWALGGASAGGNLAAAATLRLLHGRGPIPALAVLAYPTLHAVQEEPDAALSAALAADPAADVFGPDALRGMYENYLGGPVAAADVYAVPGLATTSELAGFPPTIMITSEVDELRVSGEQFARALRAAGVELDASTEPGTRHGHLNRPDERAAEMSAARFARRILSLSAPSLEH
ncbi:alpha/beta hydrolase [Microbacterium sp. KR10-403]|uniref:alpha/beta hydrolase n=1 Tax=Microbacterium sp. KR10-403 TaxID=3158581 RepID=UPI0032E3E9BC